VSSTTSVIELLERLQSTNLVIYQERCVVVRNRNSSCRRCSAACASGAIAIVDNTLSVTADLCIGCGTCASVCPTAAIEATNPDDNQLLRSAVRLLREQAAEPVFACSQVHDQKKGGYDRVKVIEVACLGRIEETELVALLAAGADRVYLVSGDCQHCENKNGAQAIALIQETLATLLALWGSKNPVLLTDELPETVLVGKGGGKLEDSASGLSRRDFFRQIKHGAQSAAASAAASTVLDDPNQPDITTRITKVLRDGSLPHFIPSRRERLLNYLDALGSPDVTALRSGYINSRLWGHVTIDVDSCNSCRMCATFCPTGALSRFEDSDGATGLEHYPADCVQCRLCEDACAPKALELSTRVPVRQIVEGTITRFELRPDDVVNVGKHPNNEFSARAISRLLDGSVQVRVR
jgi:ferredoxin